MKRKLILVFVVLLFAVGIAFGEDDATGSGEIDDHVDYITPVSITNEGIKFSDGFTGFCIDPSNGNIEKSDNFTLGVPGGSEVENDIKLAIIECYKQGKEDAMADILAQINDKGSNSDVLSEVFKSNEKVGDTAVVDIDNTTEATFEFEFLKSSDDAKSDCVAYKVSMKTVKKEEPLTSAGEDNTTDDNQSDEKEDKLTSNNASNAQKSDDNKEPKKTGNIGADNKKADTKKTTNENGKKTTDEKNTTNTTNKSVKKAAKSKNNDTVTNETNKTITNKTNTVIINENNTTIINKNNVKTINNTTSDEPQDNPVQGLLNAGNPILILIIVVVVIAVVVVVMRRKD